MSAFLDSTPALEVAVENVIGGRRYPIAGESLATVDTGYAGFMGMPSDAFEELGFRELELDKRALVFANGERTESEGSYARLRIKESGDSVYGFVETWRGLDEVVMGTDALSSFKLEVDYCLGLVSIQRCGGSRQP
ncbi:MAG: clan AA aspartic protease [Nitrososphaerota archaeon]|nr:clan AA aspartic protease [Nitrososphaerota archaeon]MDG6975640.1 clan AA aspartic protease [Nitrososphaerota archaeon]